MSPKVSITRTSVDYATLPPLLLELVKAHARVEHTRDDTLLQTYTAAAIAMVERKCNINVNPAGYLMTADALCPGPWTGTWRARGALRWMLPVNNVVTFVANDDAGGDISNSFELSQEDFGGSGASYLLGVDSPATMPWTAALLTLTVGMQTVEEISPGLVALIARIAASHYENREASAELWQSGFDDELMAFWRPSA